MHRDWIWFSPNAVSCTSITKRLCQMPTQRCWELRAKETRWEGGQMLFVVFYVLSWDKQHVIRVLYRSKCSCVNPTWLQVTTCHTELFTYCIFHGGHMKLFTHWFVHFEPCIHDALISSVASLPFNHQAVKELASGNLGTGTCALESAECMCLFLFMHTHENSLYIKNIYIFLLSIFGDRSQLLHLSKFGRTASLISLRESPLPVTKNNKQRKV